MASYALVAQKPLTWKWTKLFSPARGRIGSFENFEETVALTRVSRQLHAELSPLIWEVNTFEFNHIRMADDLRITALSEACSLFTRSMSPYQLAKLSIRLEVYGGVSTDHEFGAGSVPQTLSQIAQQLPQTRIQVVDRCWTLHKMILKDRREIVAFVQTKHKIERKLATHNLDVSNRTWRVFPRVFQPELDAVQEALRYEGFEDACDWIETGI